jgi:hypothetical protein
MISCVPQNQIGGSGEGELACLICGSVSFILSYLIKSEFIISAIQIRLVLRYRQSTSRCASTAIRLHWLPHERFLADLH